MERLRAITVVIFVIAGLVGGSQQASASSVHLVATINGSGRAMMDAASPIQGTTTYFIHARLYSDGTVIGRFDCVDLAGATIGGGSAAGDFFGPITRWAMLPGGEITLSGTGKLRPLGGPLDPADYPYTITIQKFGGARVGHWTLDVPLFGGLICSERLTSGRLVMAITGRREERGSE